MLARALLETAEDLVFVRGIGRAERLQAGDLLSADDERILASEFAFHFLQRRFHCRAVLRLAEIRQRLIAKLGKLPALRFGLRHHSHEILRRRSCCSACGMYLKTLRHATCAAVAVFAAACSMSLPWRDEPIGQEVNVAFTFHNNLLFLSSATIDGRPGRFLFGSAERQTVLDPKFAQARAAHSLQLNERESLHVTPVILDLHGVGDGIVGADVWDGHAVTIDYRAGLLTYQKEGMHSADMVVYN